MISFSRLVSKFATFGLHAFCVFSLAIACGSFEALHATAHEVSGTICEDHTEFAGHAATDEHDNHAASTETALERSVAVAHDSCWLGSALASMSHQSPTRAMSPQIPFTSFVAMKKALTLRERSLSLFAATWSLSRGPPPLA